jgi:hypothetical protein
MATNCFGFRATISLISITKSTAYSLFYKVVARSIAEVMIDKALWTIISA